MICGFLGNMLLGMRGINQPIYRHVVIHAILEDFFTQDRFVLHSHFLHDPPRGWVADEMPCDDFV